jgi:hypothetical protein
LPSTTAPRVPLGLGLVARCSACVRVCSWLPAANLEPTRADDARADDARADDARADDAPVDGLEPFDKT